MDPDGECDIGANCSHGSEVSIGGAESERLKIEN
jgi:hypothetical protein